MSKRVQRFVKLLQAKREETKVRIQNALAVKQSFPLKG
jgi:hypothetical protein